MNIEEEKQTNDPIHEFMSKCDYIKFIYHDDNWRVCRQLKIGSELVYVFSLGSPSLYVNDRTHSSGVFRDLREEILHNRLDHKCIQISNTVTYYDLIGEDNYQIVYTYLYNPKDKNIEIFLMMKMCDKNIEDYDWSRDNRLYRYNDDAIKFKNKILDLLDRTK